GAKLQFLYRCEKLWAQRARPLQYVLTLAVVESLPKFFYGLGLLLRFGRLFLVDIVVGVECFTLDLAHIVESALDGGFALLVLVEHFGRCLPPAADRYERDENRQHPEVILLKPGNCLAQLIHELRSFYECGPVVAAPSPAV